MAKLKNKYCCLLVVLCFLVLSQVIYKDALSRISMTVQLNMWYYTRWISGKQYGDLYILSAVAKLETSSPTGYSGIVLNVWDDSINSQFYCCLKIGSAYRVARAIQTSFYDKQTTAIASQYICNIPLKNNTSSRVGVVVMDAIAEPSQQLDVIQKCKNGTYTKVYFPKSNEGKLGLCTKIAYSKLNPAHLIEWFEYQKMMGVDKVIAAKQDINSEALRVFKHYEEQGILETIDYPVQLPGDSSMINRTFEVGGRVFPQFSHDEQVSVYHCKERLQGYQYAAVVDFDEFIVSSKNQTTLELIQDLTKQYPKAAAFTFYTTFFFTNKSMPENTTLTTTYLQTVGPRWECFKNIYIPTRVKTVTTHTIEPLNSYERKTVPDKTAVLHHYRECIRGEKWKDCSQLKKPDYIMLRHKKEIQSRIKTQMKLINTKR